MWKWQPKLGKIENARVVRMTPFLFFGCWNRDGPARDMVLAAVRDSEIKTVILGGDNIYPQKVGKAKTYMLETLAHGAAFLADKTVYTAIGNHNIANPTVFEAQKKLWNISERFYRFKHDGMDFIVLDTNSMNNADMATWFAEQLAELQTSSLPYYLVQHEPYASFKKGKMQILADSAPYLHRLATYPPRAVLCADTHNYQRGVLRIGGVEITQIVVGTGGAEPDPIIVEYMDSQGRQIMMEDGMYELQDYVPGYGYLRVDERGEEFILVVPWDKVGGGGRRSRSRRTKKLMRRRNRTRRSRNRKHE